jgi:hypothetical protein
MAKPSKQVRKQRKTLLAMGEGKTDAAFLAHLRRLYCTDGRGVNVTIRNANGKGPGNVIATAIGALRITSYDKKLCLLDTDLDWTTENKKDAKRKKIELIGSTPCLEGLLLLILQKIVPATSDECKRDLKILTSKSMYEPDDYLDLFTYEKLQIARSRIADLDRMLHLYEGS